ncbi:hypothetical protein K443DRAFT_579577 [Laccaria amethystina LaAM-08-1]|jgi:hypothetical protein|uniref:Uncharacterized protein n=1 Tax=Laccaria amethystina LaAM-08-1 TaxID=1095629 RepID=A0A0C9XHU0_9AGAR|nr:hypothetical protein K443DRAFT_579577 [Laccaria amethystina LaAM-08-1]
MIATVRYEILIKVARLMGFYSSFSSPPFECELAVPDGHKVVSTWTNMSQFRNHMEADTAPPPQMFCIAVSAGEKFRAWPHPLAPLRI